MTGPEHFVRRVRARPYGPREVRAGGVTAWFHGPFLVLTVAGGTALTVRADLGDSPIATDLIELFTEAGAGRAARLPHPRLLTGEQALAGETPTVVRRVSVRSTTSGPVLTVESTGRTTGAALSTSDAVRLAEEIRRWAAPR